MELGLDLVLDRDLGIHLVEINAKPGLSGWASETRIFDWKAEDQAYYDRSVRPHIRHLANFLRSKIKRSSPATDPSLHRPASVSQAAPGPTAHK
jgi:hypothetical protein